MEVVPRLLHHGKLRERRRFADRHHNLRFFFVVKNFLIREVPESSLRGQGGGKIRSTRDLPTHRWKSRGRRRSFDQISSELSDHKYLPFLIESLISVYVYRNQWLNWSKRCFFFLLFSWVGFYRSKSKEYDLWSFKFKIVKHTVAFISIRSNENGDNKHENSSEQRLWVILKVRTLFIVISSQLHMRDLKRKRQIVNFRFIRRWNSQF